MKVAIVGASGKTGTKLVGEALKRGYQVVALCRDSSAGRLNEFSERDGCRVITAPVVSDAATLTGALAGCDALVAVSISVRSLLATDHAFGVQAAHGVNTLLLDGHDQIIGTDQTAT